MAHGLSRAPVGWQLVAFGVLLLAGVLQLPIRFIPPPADLAHPTVWLFGQLTLRLALPFCALTAAAPLLQHWLARVPGESRDPYTLYAASNTGSLVALLAYPLVIERAWTLRNQSVIWLVLYLVAAVLLLASGWRIKHKAEAVRVVPDEGPPLTFHQQASWVLLAFLPSSLLVGVTSYITADIAPIPLLWIIPLALYLLTFIGAFARASRRMPRWLARGSVLLLVGWAATFRAGATEPLAVILAIHLLLFFTLAFCCHTQLAARRPGPGQLTRFYLLIAFGGALGGAFNALVAPTVFNSLIEYPLAVLAAFVFGQSAEKLKWERRDFVFLAAYILALALLLNIPDVQRNPTVARLVTIGVPVLLAYFLSDRPVRFALALCLLLITVRWDPRLHARVVQSERNFFGVLRITADASGRYYELRHGTTLHGAAEQQRAQGSDPLTYYSERSPVADVIRMMQSRPSFQSAGVVGLGVGSLAWYARPSEHWTFFEINPAVDVIARHPTLFGFLNKSRAAELEILRGDARLRLRDVPNESYDLLVLDAFNSDAIPLHLLTREAVALYLEKLKPHGVIAVHASNRYLDLSSVLANLAGAEGAIALERQDLGITSGESANRILASIWVALARQESDVSGLLSDERWRVLNPNGKRPWTDDYSNVMGAWKK
jgi:spermidine synthase